MKILVVHNAYKFAGGEDTVVAQESELLRSHGHEVQLYHRSNKELDALSVWEKLLLPIHVLWGARGLHSFSELLNNWHPDVVHVHNTFVRISPALYYLCTKARVPVVQTLHNYRLLCSRADFYRNGVCEDCIKKSFAWPGILHACYRESRLQSAAMATVIASHRHIGTWDNNVHTFIALTEFARGKFISGGLPREKLTVKANFVAPDPGTGPHSGDYFLFVGRFSPEKRIVTLLQAWQNVGGIGLKLVGAGAPQESIEDLFRRFKSVEGVEWLGFQSREEVVRLMANARCLVFPSEWYEGFPMVIVEAYACGLPVIAARLGSMAEIVSDGVTGLHFTPGSPEDLAGKIVWANEHPEEMRKMGENARRRFEEKYTAAQNYALLIDIYQLAVEGKPRNDSRPVPA